MTERRRALSDSGEANENGKICMCPVNSDLHAAYVRRKGI